METFYSLIFEMGVLAFFGFLYYTWQKNRIIRASTAQVRANLSDFIYELHEYLDGKEDTKDYEILNDYAVSLEKVIEQPELEAMKDCVQRAPNCLPEPLDKEMSKIAALF